MIALILASLASPPFADSWTLAPANQNPGEARRIASGWPPKDEAVGLHGDRRVFFDKFEQVRDGMSKGLIRALLGEPDDVLSEPEPGPYSGDLRVAERWCYGTNGHSSFATLGIVPFGRDGKVAGFLLPLSNPPPTGWFEEGRFRGLLRVVDSAAKASGVSPSEPFDPLLYVRAINVFVPLGKERALAAIREYARISGRSGVDGLGVIHLLHLLFEIDLSTFEARSAYKAYWQGDTHAVGGAVRLFADVPFLAGAGRTSTEGGQRPVFLCLEEAARFGTLRREPLTPHDQPGVALGAALASLAGPESPDVRGAVEAMLKADWTRLVRTVLDPSMHPEHAPTWGLDGGGDAAALASLKGRAIRWDPGDGRYEFADGRVHADAVLAPSGGASWIPAELSAIEGRVLIRRSRDWFVTVMLRWESPNPTDTPVVRVRVIPEKGERLDTIAEFELPERTSRSNLAEGPSGYRAIGSLFEMSETALLALRLPVRVAVEVDGRRSVSPPIRL